ncbi:MAG: nucleotidyltransferase family protein [Bacteroidia bacterium]
MLNRDSILLILRENKEFFRKAFHVSKIGLFGSFARNQQGPESDVDILIELDGNASNVFDLKWALREFLKRKFARKVDLCNASHIKPFAKEFILKDSVYA